MPVIHRLPNLPDVRCRGEALGSPVYWLGLQWAVTADGVERRDGLYVIEKDRLYEDEGVWGWDKHMAGKGWADMEDFRAAMTFARKRWPKGKPIRASKPPRAPGTFPQLGCMIAWSRAEPGRPGEVAVGPWPDATGWSDAFDFTTGACFTARHRMQKWQRLVLLYEDFHNVVVRDHVDPQAAHLAFLAIDEYRERGGR